MASWPVRGDDNGPPWLAVALGLAAVAALLDVIGPLLPVVLPQHAAGFRATPMLVVLALLPIVVAALAAACGRGLLGAAVIGGVALFAPGRLLTDLQLAVNVSDSARPELVLPNSLDPLHPGPGLWLLIIAQLLALAAGAAAVPAARRLGGETAGVGLVDGTLGGSRVGRQGVTVGALCVGTVAAVGLLVIAPFRSDNLYLLGRPVLEQPTLPLAGGLLLVVAAVLAPTVGAAAADKERAAGGVAGSAIGLFTVALPPLVAGFAVPGLHPTSGPWIATAAAIVLAVTAIYLGRGIPGPARPTADGQVEVELPGQRGLHRWAGVLAVLAGVCALAAAWTRQIEVPAGLPQVQEVGQRLLVPSGAIMLVLGVGLLVPAAAAAIRPALSVAWVSVPMASSVALDGVFTALRIDGVAAGPGAWLSGLAAVAAVAATCCGGLAGVVERDDIDVSERACRLPVLLPALFGLALTVVGFGLPVVSASGYAEPGLWSNFQFASWGLVLALITVGVAVIVAAFARPYRGTALLLGAAAVLGVRCLYLPLTRSHMLRATAGWGLLPCLVAIVAMITAAGVALLTRREHAVVSQG